MLGSPVLQVQNTGPLHFFLEHSLAGYLLFFFSQEDTAFAFYRDMVILFHGFTSFSMCRSPIEDNILSITACLLGILSFTERWGWEMKKFLWEHIKGYWISQRQLYADPICHFRNEKGSGAEMPPAVVSGMVTRETLLSYWSIFSLSLATVPEVFANVNSVQFPSPILKWHIDHLSTFSKLRLHTFELQR